MAKNKHTLKIGYYDYSLKFIIFFLLVFGLIILYSTSAYSARMDFDGDSSYYLRHQFLCILGGIVAMEVVSRIDYHIYYRFTYYIIWGSMIMCFLVLTPLGVTRNGARRWLGFGNYFSFQPAELVKIAIIIYIATTVCVLGRKLEKQKPLIKQLVITGVIGFFTFLLTDNLSTGILVIAIGTIMLFVASPDYKTFLKIAAVFIVGFALFTFILTHFVEVNDQTSFRYVRIIVWQDPVKYSMKEGYQTLQALYAIGSGGLFGKGLGNSIQKNGYIPEAQNDMIFSIVCEELGLFGAVCLILLFAFLIWRFFIIANHAPDLFGAMISVGIMAHVAVQVIFNIAVVTNVLPNTGVTLPFISYGGTSVIILLAEMGIGLNVSSQIKKDKE